MGYAAAFAVLIASADLVFRRRDPTAALAAEEAVDLAVIVQILSWGLVGAWVLVRVLRQQMADFRALRQPGPSLQLFAATGLLFFVTSFYAPAFVSVVRAVQYLVLVTLLFGIARELADRPWAIEQLWLWCRRCFVGFVGLAVLASAGLGLWFPQWQLRITTDPQHRYTVFSTHPISTGALVGFALVLICAAWLGSGDPWLRRRSANVMALGACGVLVILLMATKSRGPLAAALAAVLVLVALTPHLRRRGAAILAMLGLGGALLLGVGRALVGDIIIRAQDMDQLLSLTGRTRLFEAAWELILERPLTGWGYLAGRAVFLDRFHWGGHSHNAYVELMLNTGLVGTVLFLVLFVSLVHRAARLLQVGGASAALGREALALTAFVLVLGVISSGFAGRPSVETVALAWAVLLVELGWRLHLHRASP